MKLCPFSYSQATNAFNMDCCGAKCAMWIPLVEVEKKGRVYRCGGHCGLVRP